MATSSDALRKLMERNESYQGYTPRTAEERQQQANSEYQSYYDQLRLAARQAADRNTLALQQQREGLNRTYEKQREASAKEYARARSQADRHALSRGMQRSYYNAQVLANLDQNAVDAQRDLWDAQGAAEGNLDERITQYQSQLADQMAQYDLSQAADAMRRARELEDTDYERGLQAQQYGDNLQVQIYNMLRQGEQDQLAQDQLAYQRERDLVGDKQWQAQFDESVRQFNVKNPQSSGSSRGTTPTINPTPSTEYPSQTTGNTLADFLKKLTPTDDAKSAAKSTISNFLNNFQTGKKKTASGGGNATKTMKQFGID